MQSYPTTTFPIYTPVFSYAERPVKHYIPINTSIPATLPSSTSPLLHSPHPYDWRYRHHERSMIFPYGKRLTRAIANSCVHCKKSHLACENQRPCNRCIKIGKADTCVDAVHKKRGRKPKTASASSEDVSRVSDTPTPSPLPSPSVPSLKNSLESPTSSTSSPISSNEQFPIHLNRPILSLPKQNTFDNESQSPAQSASSLLKHWLNENE